MIRKWATKFSKSVNKRVVARRRKINVPIKITFGPDKNTGSLQMPHKDVFIKGETKDISQSGIAFIVSSIRVNEYYLVGDGRSLIAEVTLPNGKVTMRMEGERYEQIGSQHLSINEYMVGAKIVHISDTDKEVLDEFLSNSRKRTGRLELEIDKSKA